MKKILYFVAIFALVQTKLFAVPLTVVNNSGNNSPYTGSYNVSTYVVYTQAGLPCGSTNTANPVYNFPVGSATTLNGSSIWTSPGSNQNYCLGEMVGNCGAELDWHYLRIVSMIETTDNINYYSGPINLINNNCIGNNYFPNSNFPNNGDFIIGNMASEYKGYVPAYSAYRFRITYNIYGNVLALLNFE